MSMYGFGLAADALSKSLGDIPEASLKATEQIPDLQGKMISNLQNQANLDTYNALAPIRALKNQQEAAQIQANIPLISREANAKLGKLEAEAPHMQAQTKLLDAETAAKAQATSQSRYHMVATPTGGVQIFDVDPSSPRFRQEVTEGAYKNSPLDYAHMMKLQNEIELNNAHVNHYKFLERTHGILTPKDQAELAIREEHNAILNRHYNQMNTMYENRANPIEDHKARMAIALRNEAMRSYENVRNTPLGKIAIEGGSPAQQMKLYNYMVDKQNYENVKGYNEQVGPKMRLDLPKFEKDMALEALINAAVKEPNWWRRNMPEWAGGFPKDKLNPGGLGTQRSPRDEDFKRIHGLYPEDYAKQHNQSVEDVQAFDEPPDNDVPPPPLGR